MKWVIVSCNYGRLGNRLHTHANILAWCITNDYNLSNLSFKSYSELFEVQRHHFSDSYFKTWNLVLYLMKFSFIGNFIERLILSKKWMRRLSFFFHHIEKDNFSTLEEQELNLIKTKKIIVINAWDIRCSDSINSAGNFVRKLLQPASNYIKSASDFIISLRRNNDCLIGIHARRGDYKNFLDGRYYFSWEKYKTWILELKIVLENLGFSKIGFVLCSDEKPPVNLLHEKNIYYAESNHYMEDLHSLTLLNYNMGPPSSFGTWTSWYGEVPRIILKQNTIIKSLEQFSIPTEC